jgi:hypothetical protein
MRIDWKEVSKFLSGALVVAAEWWEFEGGVIS